MVGIRVLVRRLLCLLDSCFEEFLRRLWSQHVAMNEFSPGSRLIRWIVRLHTCSDGGVGQLGFTSNLHVKLRSLTLVVKKACTPCCHRHCCYPRVIPHQPTASLLFSPTLKKVPREEYNGQRRGRRSPSMYTAVPPLFATPGSWLWFPKEGLKLNAFSSYLPI